MRRLLFLALIILIVVIIIVRRHTRLKQTEKFLIENICQSLENEYRESIEKSMSFWLTRLRQIRKQYGDEIAQKVSLKLKEKLKEKKI
jgi:uncharacterized protein YsxB (DUF464 family)